MGWVNPSVKSHPMSQNGTVVTTVFACPPPLFMSDIQTSSAGPAGGASIAEILGASSAQTPVTRFTTPG